MGATDPSLKISARLLVSDTSKAGGACDSPFPPLNRAKDPQAEERDAARPEPRGGGIRSYLSELSVVTFHRRGGGGGL